MTNPAPQPGILDIKPYVPGKSAVRKDMRVIKLSSNENPYGPNPNAMEAFKEAAFKLHRYPDGNASALTTAIAKSQNVSPEQIVCGAGSDELIGLLVNAYAGVGDEVLYSAHGFLMYRIYALAAGAVPVTAPEKNLTADVDALLSAVTPKTKIVFLANPNNPTGTIISESELNRLREKLPPHIILAVDGAYAEYLEDGDALAGKKLAATTDNTVMLRTFSKIYGIPSLRLGWMFGPKAICDVLHRVRGPFNVSGPAQAAGVAAIGDAAFVKEQRELNREQRESLTRDIEALGLRVVPSVTNFILVQAGSAAKATVIVDQLADEGIFIREVSAYGLAEYVRISVGTAEENQILLEKLRLLYANDFTKL